MRNENDNYLKEFVSDVLTKLEWKEEMEERYVRFTISLDPIVNKRLEYVAKQIGWKKSEIASEAVHLLVTEFERQLGLSFEDPKYRDLIFKNDNKKDTAKKKDK